MANFATVALGNNIATAVLGEEPKKVLGPIIEGATRPTWVITILHADNSALNLTGATFTGVLYDPLTSVSKAATVGSYAITTAASGIFTYSPVSGDVDTPGVWLWETTLTISSQTYKIRLPIVIEEKLS